MRSGTKLAAVLAAVAVVAYAEPERACVCDEMAKGLKEACHRGHRFYGYARSPLASKESVLAKCSDDCSDAYGDQEKEKDACVQGCRHMSQHRREFEPITLSLGGGGGGSLFDLLGLPDVFGAERGDPADSIMNTLRVPEMGEEPMEDAKGLGSFFDQVHNTMRNMMRGIMGGDGDIKLPGQRSGGELVVVRSGPGYHETKTYHLGPNSKVNIGNLVQSGMRDMMNHKNPMEKFNELNDVEVFDPSALPAANRDGNAVVEVGDAFDRDPWGLIRKAPRLPEAERAFADADEDSPDAKRTWSSWLTCLRAKIGLPSWLMAASLALGVIFSLWLCMVIPSSAPKQKARKGKMMIGTKEAEAMGISTVVSGGHHVRVKVDLPPPYDDVTKRGALDPEPVHLLKPKDEVANDDVEAGPLPAKNEVA